MATKSFLKNISIRNKDSAKHFIEALENAEGKGRKKVNYEVSVKTIKDADTIRKIFNA